MSSVIEILKSAEDNIETILAHKNNNYLRNLMEAAYLPEKKLKLPDGIPPYKENPMEEGQVGTGVFWQICRKLDIYQKTYDKQTMIRIETSFIQALETVSASEAKVLLAVKEQTLDNMFKGVTLARLQAVGYFP